MMKSRRMQWAGYVTRMEVKRKHIYDIGEKARRKETTMKTKE
jgi:hypothetical protein